MNGEIAIKVEGVSKTFKLPHEKTTSIKSAFIGIHKKKKNYEKQQALKDISFDIKKGEFFGIVGRNGSGKSTLLKIISQIYTPDSGSVSVSGKLTPFIELGVGFNPELSGRENVYLNGALLGFSRKEMKVMYDDIVEFAELERFMDQKLKNYSSGMQVRLAFSIAIRADSDILVLDEVLAVGDEAFQRKCNEYFNSLKRDKKTVVLVTHDMSSVEEFCDRAVLIEKSRIIEAGDVKAVTSAYRDLLNPNIKHKEERSATLDENRWGDHSYSFGDVRISVNEPSGYGATIQIQTELKCSIQKYNKLILAFAIKDNSGRVLFGDKHTITSSQIPATGQENKVSLSFKNILSTGKYSLDLSIFSPRDNTYSDTWLDCKSFYIKNNDGTGFTVISPSNLKISKG